MIIPAMRGYLPKRNLAKFGFGDPLNILVYDYPWSRKEAVKSVPPPIINRGSRDYKSGYAAGWLAKRKTSST